MIDDDECGAVGGIRIGRGNRSTRRKPVPMSLFPSQIPNDVTFAGNRAAAVGSQRLTAWNCLIHGATLVTVWSWSQIKRRFLFQSRYFHSCRWNQDPVLRVCVWGGGGVLYCFDALCVPHPSYKIRALSEYFVFAAGMMAICTTHRIISLSSTGKFNVSTLGSSTCLLFLCRGLCR
jgi:hypothetical protein